MSEGFSKENIEVSVNTNEINKILKKYKKIKKYQRSPLFEVKTMGGTETYVSKLIQEGQENL
jgi:hypothetical protein